MPKILHTSDWHLGIESWIGSKSTDRLEELKVALNFLVEKAKEEKVDLILITGDVLHNRVSPRLEALNLLADILAKFASLAPTIVVLGNHDWQGLKAWKNLKVKNLFIVDEPVVEPLQIGNFNIFAIPYIDVQRLLEFHDNLARAKDFLNWFFEEVRQKINPYKLNIVAGHLMVEGSIESERENHIEVEIKTTVVPTGIDYVALGHIHHQGQLSVNPTVCYCGSPIIFDFGEEKESKGALIVDFEGSQKRILEIKTPCKKLKTFYLSDYSAKTIDKLSDELKSFEGYARLVFDAPESNEVRRYFMDNFECVRKVVFKNEYDSTSILTQIKKLDLLDMYKQFIKGRFEGFEDKMIQTVEEILKEVEEL
ncbi:metallophosphoesterase family protein [Pseudothermotoga thermarum]|uniref:Nuclease SbcCD subunit D n=1 Tax=Pseudothermotoga thermarum DSM 5069 TaxID=688269 RepID=F7YX54_9THEM|nr:exonuclease SbcCD subunit D [Pseudothermotoga thermarum]AEH50891.1 nuclease SbcCD, D subunit [Pseudothermotoga thermarum DSM 5069]